MTNRKILVIDDEPLILSSLSALLSDEYEVATAEEGVSGLSTFCEFHPSLVLLDINMPFINGVEVLSRIREMDSRIPVIVMTGNRDSDPLWARRCKELGASGYLIKPVLPEELLHMIKTVEKLKYN